MVTFFWLMEIGSHWTFNYFSYSFTAMMSTILWFFWADIIDQLHLNLGTWVVHRQVIQWYIQERRYHWVFGRVIRQGVRDCDTIWWQHSRSFTWCFLVWIWQIRNHKVSTHCGFSLTIYFRVWYLYVWHFCCGEIVDIWRFCRRWVGWCEAG